MWLDMTPKTQVPTKHLVQVPVHGTASSLGSSVHRPVFILEPWLWQTCLEVAGIMWMKECNSDLVTQNCPQPSAADTGDPLVGSTVAFVFPHKDRVGLMNQWDACYWKNDSLVPVMYHLSIKWGSGKSGMLLG